MAGLIESELIRLTRREVEKYAGTSPNATAYPLLDDERKTYAVNAVYNEPRAERAWVIVQAHVANEQVIIDEDNVFDKPLVDALVQAGIPRAQIVLAYAGEPVIAENPT